MDEPKGQGTAELASASSSCFTAEERARVEHEERDARSEWYRAARDEMRKKDLEIARLRSENAALLETASFVGEIADDRDRAIARVQALEKELRARGASGESGAR